MINIIHVYEHYRVLSDTTESITSQISVQAVITLSYKTHQHIKEDAASTDRDSQY
jgi:hypothetical protein